MAQTTETAVPGDTKEALLARLVCPHCSAVGSVLEPADAWPSGATDEAPFDTSCSSCKAALTLTSSGDTLIVEG